MATTRFRSCIFAKVIVPAWLVLALCLLFSAAAHAYGLNDCPSTRFGSDLVCTANDVSITGIAIAPGGPAACVGGQTITLNLKVTVNFATPDRWDVGIFFANDGKSPQLLPANGGAGTCSVSILPTPATVPTTPFLNLDGPTDTCGDGNGGISGGLGYGVLDMYNVPVACQAVDLSGGRLFIPFVTTWDNQSTPPGLVCRTAADPVPNTKSKCNAPDGTVMAEVLKSTVALVVLPTISKNDYRTTITAGDSTTYDVVITNTTGATLRNAIFRDPAVADLTVTSLGCSGSGVACPPLSVATMQGGGIALPDMPVNSSLTFHVGATVSAAAVAGTLTNTAYVVVDGQSNPAADTDNVITRLGVGKAFSPASIPVNGEATLSITLRNTNLADATGVTFTDNYPAGLVNATSPEAWTDCGGTVTAAASAGTLRLQSGTIPAGGSCTVTAKVTSAFAGAYANSTGTVTSAQGYAGGPATAFLAVGVSNLSTSTKTYTDPNGGELDPGETLRYTITLRETAGIAATGVSVSDTVNPLLTGLTVVSCPSGATCSFTGQTLTATGINIPANGSATIVFSATVPPGTPAGTTLNNCADIANPGAIGASPCSETVLVSPSAVAGAGNKRLYLHDAAAGYKLSRTIPAAASPVTVAAGTSRTWSLSPTLAAPVTISPNVTPLAIIPVNLYLASDVANQSRSVRVDVTCSGGGPTYSETKLFDGSAVNNPYLGTTPDLVAFNKLTIAADHFCGTGQSWRLTVSNSGAGSVIVHPVSGGSNSYLSLPSLNIINVDSVRAYSAAYPAVTVPASGSFGAGQTIYLRATVSDPFGSYDIAPTTAPTISIKNPAGATMVVSAAMDVKASTALTKTFEYVYTIPAGAGSTGSWMATVTAPEGTEGTILDSGTGAFYVGMANLLVVKSVAAYSDPIHGTSSPKPIPGAFMTYTIQVTNTGQGPVDADTTVVTDRIPDHTELFVGDFDGPGPNSGPVLFSQGATPSGLTYSFIDLASPADSLFFSADGSNYGKADTAADTNQCDPTVKYLRIAPGGVFAASDGTNHPSFSVRFRIRIK